MFRENDFPVLLNRSRWYGRKSTHEFIAMTNRGRRGKIHPKQICPDR